MYGLLTSIRIVSKLWRKIPSRRLLARGCGASVLNSVRVFLGIGNALRLQRAHRLIRQGSQVSIHTY